MSRQREQGLRGCRQAGLTLVELMVALVMGLVLLAGLATVFLANKQTYRHQDALARLQENGRFSIAILERDIRAAGFTGRDDFAVVANTVETVPEDAPKKTKTCDDANAPSGFGEAVDGFDDFGMEVANEPESELAYLSPQPIPGTDILRVHTSREMGVRILKQPAAKGGACPGSAPLFITSCSELSLGQSIMILDRSGQLGAFIVVSGLTSDNKKECQLDNKANLIHNTGVIPDSGIKNCSKCLNADFTGGSVLGMDQHLYYVGITPRGVPALYRSTNYRPAEELVEGVEDMQIRFGVGGDDIRAVDSYEVADEMWAGKAANEYPAWRHVRSVRVQLLLQSPDANTLSKANQIAFDIETYLAEKNDSDEFEAWPRLDSEPFADGRWRQLYTTTVAVRNRIP